MNIISIYGTTEVRDSTFSINPVKLSMQTGTIMNSERDFSGDKKWNWVRPTALSKHYMVMEPQGNNTFECIVKDGYPSKASCGCARDWVASDAFRRLSRTDRMDPLRQKISSSDIRRRRIDIGT